MNKTVLAHFSRVDPTLSLLYTNVSLTDLVPRKPRQFFESLCNEIISQQLSGRVAAVIEKRFKKLFTGSITPQKVAAISEVELRATGMSWSKARFIKDLAHKVLHKEVSLSHLETLDDAKVIAELTKVKGIGPWTAEMFLMFTLGREDIFSFGDLGLKRAIQKAYRMKKEPSLLQMKRLSKKWKPYRTIAARVLWKSLETSVSSASPK